MPLYNGHNCKTGMAYTLSSSCNLNPVTYKHYSNLSVTRLITIDNNAMTIALGMIPKLVARSAVTTDE